MKEAIQLIFHKGLIMFITYLVALSFKASQVIQW